MPRPTGTIPMLSRINLSSTRAYVFVTDFAGKTDPDFVVAKRKGVWKTFPYLGGESFLTLPTELSARKLSPTGKPVGQPIVKEVPLGVVLKLLRLKLRGEPVPAVESVIALPQS